MSQLIAPHGGELVNLMVSDERAAELTAASKDLPDWDLTARQTCDIEMIMSGAFSPLTGFLGKADYDGVLNDMRLADGTLWPMPIMLDVTDEVAEGLSEGSQLALRDAEGVLIGVLNVSDVWKPDFADEAQKVFGSTDTAHPGVAHLMNSTNPNYVGGTIEGLAMPLHYDYQDLRQSPAEVRAQFEADGWDKVVAFQTRNPMHRAHQELTIRASAEIGGKLLIHPVVGMTKPGDVDHYTRVRCYKALMESYPEGSAALSLLPLAMRMGGPREAVWHAIIRKNHGCTHFIVGRDHAGPGKDSNGEDFYGPYDAQDLLRAHTDELGVEMVEFKLMVYLPEDDEYCPIDEVPEGKETASISGTEQREKLAAGEDLPSWFTFPAVADELRASYATRAEQGFTVFFTGLSGSGKSTIANALLVKMLEKGGKRSVTLLDGDLVRKNLSSELGFSKEHRDLNVSRIGYVASEITKAGGIAVCAPIAPYADIRAHVRNEISGVGGYYLVHVATSLEECERRDRKGLYAKAREGIIKEFTGISDPYDVPEDAEIVIQTEELSADAAADVILDRLAADGYYG
jgi:sulfate adenylyltransferase